MGQVSGTTSYFVDEKSIETALTTISSVGGRETILWYLHLRRWWLRGEYNFLEEQKF
jgi:hypothetical protein